MTRLQTLRDEDAAVARRTLSILMASSRRVRPCSAAGACGSLLLLSVPMATACASVLDSCAAAVAHLALPAATAERVSGYVSELLTYNERTNVYSKSAYEKLPFHVADSVTLALDIRDGRAAQRGVLDLGSGSGLPSVIIACVNPELPVFAVESKSRKTRFLTHAARRLGLENYTPLTQNVNELSRSWYFDVDVVTAKAFKPLPEVGPIGAKCILGDAQLLVPISEAQVLEFELGEERLARHGDFLYFSEALSPTRDSSTRKLVTREAARTSRL